MKKGVLLLLLSSCFSFITQSQVSNNQGLNYKLPDLNYQLGEAINNNNLEEVKRLIKDGALTEPYKFVTPLPQVAYPFIKEDIFTEILNASSDIDVKDKAGETALTRALFYLSAPIDERQILKVKALLEKGANPNLVNSKGFTPLSLAIRSNNIDLVKMLLRAGAVVNQSDIVLSKRYPNIFELLRKFQEG